MLPLLVTLLVLTTQIGSLAVAQTAAAPSAPTTGPRAEFLTEMKVSRDRFVSLAEAIPAEKYIWRPGEGVRSISEVFLHVAAANYNLPKLIGTPAPEGFKIQGYDKSTTEKAKVVAALKDSFDHVREAVNKMPDADLEKQLDWFGGKNTERGILFFMMRHMSEHLGQSISYARMNGITPPWTEEAQREQQKKAAEKPKQ